MRLIRLLPPVLTLALLLPAAEASAQRLSLDGTLGSRTGSSERYVSHQALDLDLTLGMRTRGGPGTSFAAALSLGAQAEAPGDLVCEVLEEEEVPECARMPGAVSFAALAGLQRT
ncbi:MAG TPA: hypothetical protein VFQ45_12380, partial [Longimicrobium sp.]|nr:hypothetical protein [Longimicrobium sp.]